MTQTLQLTDYELGLVHDALREYRPKNEDLARATRESLLHRVDDMEVECPDGLMYCSPSRCHGCDQDVDDMGEYFCMVNDEVRVARLATSASAASRSASSGCFVPPTSYRCRTSTASGWSRRCPIACWNAGGSDEDNRLRGEI